MPRTSNCQTPPAGAIGREFARRGPSTTRAHGSAAWRRRRAATSLSLLVLASACMIGPDYKRPEPPVAAEWIGRGQDRIAPPAEPIGPWWDTFGDPTLSDLIAQAYRQNPSLQAAGVRVIEAQARRGIAIGTLFPQTQNLVGAYRRTVASENTVVTPPERSYDQFLAGFDVAWEVDLWGKFRRGIESADAEVLAALANYDDVLVSLLAEVATNYIGIRTAQEELDVARRNVELQRGNYSIASRRATEGAVSDVDPAQAATLLHNTEAQIPTFEASIDAQAATLSALIGTTPRRVEELLGGARARIPTPPATIAMGLPADLLRRRPDVRRSERVLAAQSAEIGIARADLLPHLSLVGSINLDAKDAAKFFAGESFEAFGGPTLSWAILNYGRITNNVRVQDARYQALVNDYTTAVLGAQAEVESAVADHRGARLRTVALRKSVTAAQKVVDLVGQQYGEGAVDFTTVLLSQEFLVDQQDLLAASKGREALTLVTLYKALGGGWEPFEGGNVVSAENAAEMRSRTRWGELLEEHEQRNIEQAASTGTEQDRGWWRWRWWRPQW
jgi:NodT family efflux transporter outer membrane factor (OMF) lipoprotein